MKEMAGSIPASGSMCIGFTEAASAGALIAWAQCWFAVLAVLVTVTILVLFIIALTLVW